MGRGRAVAHFPRARSDRRLVRRTGAFLAVALVDAAVHAPPRRGRRRPGFRPGLAAASRRGPGRDAGRGAPPGRPRVAAEGRRPHLGRWLPGDAALAVRGGRAGPAPRRSRRRACTGVLLRRADVPGLPLGGDARPGRARRRAGSRLRGAGLARTGGRHPDRGRARRPPGVGGGRPDDGGLRAPLRVLPAAAVAGRSTCWSTATIPSTSSRSIPTPIASGSTSARACACSPRRSVG